MTSYVPGWMSAALETVNYLQYKFDRLSIRCETPIIQPVLFHGIMISDRRKGVGRVASRVAYIRFRRSPLLPGRAGSVG